jgi:hypothetical protein
LLFNSILVKFLLCQGMFTESWYYTRKTKAVFTVYVNTYDFLPFPVFDTTAYHFVGFDFCWILIAKCCSINLLTVLSGHKTSVFLSLLANHAPHCLLNLRSPTSLSKLCILSLHLKVTPTVVYIRASYTIYFSAVSWQHYVTSLAFLHNDWTDFISIKLETNTSLINHTSPWQTQDQHFARFNLLTSLFCIWCTFFLFNLRAPT